MNTTREPRERLIYRLRVFLCGPTTLLGMLYDVSATGMLVRGARSLEPGTRTRLRIETPHNVGGDYPTWIEVPAHVVRCHSRTESFEIGIEFGELGDEEHDCIQMLIGYFSSFDDSPGDTVENPYLKDTSDGPIE